MHASSNVRGDMRRTMHRGNHIAPLGPKIQSPCCVRNEVDDCFMLFPVLLFVCVGSQLPERFPRFFHGPGFGRPFLHRLRQKEHGLHPVSHWREHMLQFEPGSAPWWLVLPERISTTFRGTRRHFRAACRPESQLVSPCRQFSTATRHLSLWYTN